MRRKGRPAVRFISLALGVAVLAASAVYVADVIEAGALRQVVEAVLSDPLALAVALMAYAAAFAVRAQAGQRTFSQSSRWQPSRHRQFSPMAAGGPGPPWGSGSWRRRAVSAGRIVCGLPANPCACPAAELWRPRPRPGCSKPRSSGKSPGWP